MRVLLTGSTGFVGSNALKYLLDNTDWNITCVCSWRHTGGPGLLKPNPRVEVIIHDLTEPIPFIGMFDYILNIASESHVDRSIKDPANFIENNVSSVINVLEYARKFPVKTFIQFSTDEVYGTSSHNIWDVLLPSNPYAASKACQEMICISYWRTYGVPIVISNSNNIVGPNQNKEKFIPKIIDLISNNKEVTIHTHKGLPGIRNYNPVDNVSSALLFILGLQTNSYPQTDRPDRYSISGGERLDNLEIATKVAALLGKSLITSFIDAESVRPGYDEMYEDLDRSLEQLGWIPPQTLDQGLEWIKNC